MKKLLILAIFLIYANAAYAVSGISAVWVQNNEIFISTGSGGQVQLTHNALPKDNPVFSKDGSMIAFTEQTPQNVALDSLVVIDTFGNRIHKFLIHPVDPSDPNAVIGGMRFVERITWLTNSKIAVAGSIDPSSVETNTFDISSGKELESEDNITDGFPVYSPDGLHYAFVAGVPHFTAWNDQEPEFDIDNNQRIYPPTGTQAHFITNPAWSADSQNLAIVAMGSNNTSNIVIWHIGDAQPSLVPIPIKKEQNRYVVAKLFWSGEALTVTSDEGDWSYSQGTLTAISPSQAVDPRQAAWDLKANLEKSLGIGPSESDFWCQSCPLTLLPRRSPEFVPNSKAVFIKRAKLSPK